MYRYTSNKHFFQYVIFQILKFKSQVDLKSAHTCYCNDLLMIHINEILTHLLSLHSNLLHTPCWEGDKGMNVSDGLSSKNLFNSFD